MQRVFSYFMTTIIVLGSACAADVSDPSQAEDGEEAPEVALTSEAVFHNDSLTFLRQDGLGGTNRTVYGVTGTLRVQISGAQPNNEMLAKWDLKNGNVPSRVKWAFAVHCENSQEDFNWHGDDLLNASNTDGQAWLCNRVRFAEFSFIVDNAVTSP